MPNLLVHLGVQGALSSVAVRDVDLKWVYAGAVVPDVPWIVQRAVLTLAPEVDPYALRYYVDVQASLIVSLLCAGALAMLAAAPRRVAVVMGFNVGLHLILDALQIKWGNGVHLLAPFSWELVNWGMFWPESPLNVVLTLGGLLFVILTARRAVRRGVPLQKPDRRRAVAFGVLAGAYLLLPLWWLDGPREANVHDLETLREPGRRPGQYVEFDRKSCVPLDAEACLLLGTFRAEGLPLEREARVSVRGVFVDTETIRVLEAHVHHPWFRDVASYLGLLAVMLIWMVWFVLSRREARTRPDPSAV
ncbi:hypothetical protein AWN76_015400 [Rhodothermaceae bacterium RA]|nr:hypothetical protein AWN76_015400 [Rhodothermaceae bacterium RA]